MIRREMEARMPTAPEVRSTDDIQLAYQTLLFLDAIPSERARCGGGALSRAVVRCRTSMWVRGGCAGSRARPCTPSFFRGAICCAPSARAAWGR